MSKVSFVVPEVDERLLLKYDQSGPRYTSYPTAPNFTPSFGEEIYRKRLASSPSDNLSIYCHLPFCESVCFFCGCNVTFTSDRSRPEPYIGILTREMDLVLAHLPPGKKVRQLHWGGGTPTFFQPGQMRRVWEALVERFHIAADAEIGIEIDPRETSPEHLQVLRECGFNRLSMGVQDFHPEVQKAINRIQPKELTCGMIRRAKEMGFASVSVDLIYGLPCQTPQSFEETLASTIEADPDRIALFNFAYLPEMIRHQKAIAADRLPTPQQKIEILSTAIREFTAAGYRYVGMDHFAKPGDEMCRAQDEGTLYRNFQGYTTHAGCDLLAFGVSSISQVGASYAQNEKNIHDYVRRVEAGQLPVMRGVNLVDDDILRRDVIMRLMCDFRLDFSYFSGKHGRDFPVYFSRELAALAPLIEDGLVALGRDGIEVTPPGRLLVRNICMVFDRYLSQAMGYKFSRTV